MEKKVLSPSRRLLFVSMIECVLTSALTMLCVLDSFDNGHIDWTVWPLVVIMVLLTCYTIPVAMQQIRQSIILDEKEITLYNCATRMENDTLRVTVGTVTLKWADITAIEQRLIRTTSGETYSDGAKDRKSRFRPETKSSPFGSNGWAEIVRYYNAYKAQ